MRDGDLPFHLLPRPAQLAMDILELPEESIDQAFSVLFDKDMELYDQTYSIFKQLRKEMDSKPDSSNPNTAFRYEDKKK